MNPLATRISLNSSDRDYLRTLVERAKASKTPGLLDDEDVRLAHTSPSAEYYQGAVGRLLEEQCLARPYFLKGQFCPTEKGLAVLNA